MWRKFEWMSYILSKIPGVQLSCNYLSSASGAHQSPLRSCLRWLYTSSISGNCSMLEVTLYLADGLPWLAGLTGPRFTYIPRLDLIDWIPSSAGFLRVPCRSWISSSALSPSRTGSPRIFEYHSGLKLCSWREIQETEVLLRCLIFFVPNGSPLTWSCDGWRVGIDFSFYILDRPAR